MNRKIKVYNKLVRDKIPEIIKASKSVVRIFNKKTRVDLLFNKIDEETFELKQAIINDENILEELADVYEVLKCIGNEFGYSMEEIIKKAKDKEKEKGSFRNGQFLEWVEE